MKTSIFTGKQSLPILTLLLCVQFAILFQSCQKSTEPLANEEIATKKNPHNPPPPPPPPPFYFSDCYNPLYSATMPKGIAANVSITKNYVNSPGGSYPAFTSATVNGITVTAPAGTFNTGSGSVVFTATGTPINTGYFYITIQVGNIQPCNMYFIVNNPPVSGPTADPAATPGSLGIVNFTYRGQAVAYQTVRARDGKIWLQQNLGSSQVAFHHSDESSYGDYFQWGRWDDGHQAFTSPIISGGPSLMNPSDIPSGNPNFITSWWGSGGLATDTWSGTTATSANGKDPCVALGAGWRSPTAADWANLKNYEDLEGAMTAFNSNLKLPIAGYRSGNINFGNGESYYWSSTAAGNYATVLLMSDNTYSATLQATYRGYGIPCRCMKD